MLVTILLTVGMMVLFTLMEWVACEFMPMKSMADFFPEDIQERLRPRIESITLTPKRIIGKILFALILLGMLGIFVFAGVDGIRNGFTYGQFLIRFLIIGVGIKLFDIIVFDWFVITKTHYFQHFFPETEGCEGWHQFGYNRKQQLRQTVMILLSAPVSSAVFYLIGRHIG